MQRSLLLCEANGSDASQEIRGDLIDIFAQAAATAHINAEHAESAGPSSAPDRVTIFPKGRDFELDGKRYVRVDTRDGRAFIFKSAADLVAITKRELPLPFDTGHMSEWYSGAEAVGWAESLEAVDETYGPIVASVEWNSKGVELLGDRRMRKVSPAMSPGQLFTSLGDTRIIEITGFTSVALVARPAFGNKLPLVAQAETRKTVMLDKALLAALGLSETATLAEAVAAAASLKAANADLAARLATSEKTIADVHEQRLVASVEALIKAEKIKPEKRSWALAQARKGLDEFLSGFDDDSPCVGPGAPQTAKLRVPVGPAGLVASDGLTDEERTWCAAHKVDPKAHAERKRQLAAQTGLAGGN